MPTILFDGWPLIYNPISPESLHLLDLLHQNPEGVNPLIALPSEPPAWFPDQFETAVQPTPNRPWNRLVWEQSVIPRMFRGRKADLIHLTRPTVPLLQASSAVISPASLLERRSIGTSKRKEGSPWDRMREAAAKAAAAQARAFLWPADLAELSGLIPHNPVILPPLFTSEYSFYKEKNHQQCLPDLPETFVLYHGPGEVDDLFNLLNSWSWAAGAIGDYYPLVVLGLSNRGKRNLSKLLKDYQFEDSLRILSDITPWQIPKIYQKSSALFHPTAGSPWSGSLRIGLAANIPIAASDEAITSRIVNKAAYLTRAGDYRSCGAAIISIIVDESISKNLSEAARKQSKLWSSETFKQELKAAYRDILKTI
jgi:glycosyltransferase involved in cell wall biosynthesis